MTEESESNYELQAAGISLISAVAQADSVIHPNELEVIADMLNKEWGIVEIAAPSMAEELTKQDISKEDVVYHCETFTKYLNDEDRLSFLKTLIGVATADKELHDKERDCISFIAENMGVSSDEISAICK